MPPLAIAGVAAVAGAGASIISSNNNKNAIKDSTAANLQAQRESIAAQNAALDKQLALQRESLDKGLAFQQGALDSQMGYQTGAYNSSGKLQTDIYNNNVGTFQPFVQGGYAAGNQINALLGLPQQQGFTPEQVNFTPVTVPPRAATPTPAATPAPTPAPTPTGNALMPATVTQTIKGRR